MAPLASLLFPLLAEAEAEAEAEAAAEVTFLLLLLLAKLLESPVYDNSNDLLLLLSQLES